MFELHCLVEILMFGITRVSRTLFRCPSVIEFLQYRSLPMPLRDAFNPQTWKKIYTMHDVESCLARVQVVGFNEKRVSLLLLLSFVYLTI